MKQGYIFVGLNVFDTLFAVSAQEQEQGLMFQKWPPPNMSFIYASPRVNKFWMKNTECPLDIIFCLNGKVKEICRGEPHSTAIIGSDSVSDLIIELPAGTAENFKIKIGDRAGVLAPDLSEIIKQSYK